MTNTFKSFWLASSFLASILAFSLASSSTMIFAQTGAELYQSKTCYSCHGVNAQGLSLLESPSLAGQDSKYIADQLLLFKAGGRGYNHADYSARSMQPTAQNLTDAEINTLADYLSKLKPQVIPHQVAGNPAAGKELYVTCAACHGDKATGNRALNAPNLQILPDYYFVKQLVNFKNGLRGDPNVDLVGASMAVNATNLSLKDMKDLAAYVNTLKY